MNLSYQALDRTGKLVSNIVEAESIRNAVEALRQQGLMVTSISASSAKEVLRRAKQSVEVQSQQVKLPLRQLLLFTRQMGMLLTSGSAVVPALTAIARQIKGGALSTVVRSLAADLEGGVTMTEAMRKWPRCFDASYSAVIAAGEASASLPSMFNRMSAILSKQRALRRKLLASLAYPALLSGLCLGVVSVLLFFVLPRFGEMFKSLQVPLPKTTQFMLQLADFLKQYWFAVAVGAAGVVTAVAFMVCTAQGRQWWADGKTRLPGLGGMFSRLIQGQMFRTLGMLMEAKVGVLESLELLRGSTRNGQYQRLFNQMEQAVSGGNALSDALDASGLVAPSICQAVRTGEQSGSLGGAITYAADILDEDNAELVDTTMRLLEPAIVILMGFIVGAVAISLFLPMFDMTTMVN